MQILDKLDPKGKKILVRLDLDVPIGNGEVIDGFRIDAGLPTLEYLKKAEQIIILGHAGRPEGKIVPELSLKPQAEYLAQKLSLDVKEEKNNFLGPHYLLGDQIVILENLRFDSGEENNDLRFTKRLAHLGEAFVFEAFAVSHRRHASVTGLSEILPSYLGLRCQKEIDVLCQLRNEASESIMVIGGAKVEDKSGIIQKYPALKVLFGGKTASEVWLKKDEYKDEKFILPVDGKLETGEVKNYSDLSKKELNAVRDIGPRTTNAYSDIIHLLGKNIIFAGPMGQYEKEEFGIGTKTLMEAAIKSQKNSVILGGDSALAANMFGFINQISYISVGGGASLSFLVTGKTALIC